MIEINITFGGLGSAILTHFIKFAKTLCAEFISGEFSFVDIGTAEKRSSEQAKNRERLYHFYSKHGFEISENETIHLKL